jgi:serine/threonine-protein kinase
VLPGVVGDPLKQAKRAIRAAHLSIGRVFRQSSSLYSAGQVISTDPPAGQTLPVGTKIDLFVSSGPAKVTVPDVTSESEGQAKANLNAAGFKVSVAKQTSSTAPAGTVISQTPTGGTPELPGSAVTIVVATAPTTATVPDVHGQPVAAATSALRQAGFKVSQQPKDVTSQSQDGIVLSESPHHGTTAQKGSTVTITVGHYVAATTTTPTTTTPTTTTPPTG